MLVFGNALTTQIALQSPVDCVSGLLAEPLPFDDCLVSPVLCTKWCTGVWRPTEAVASSVGDEFYTRAKLVGVFVDNDGVPDRSLDKGRKIYGLGAPTTTLTLPNNFNFVDDRSSDPLLVGVRQLEFTEVLNTPGFDDDRANPKPHFASDQSRKPHMVVLPREFFRRRSRGCSALRRVRMDAFAS